MFYLLFILPGLIVAYVFYLRPVLKAMPQLKRFYDEADGFWQTTWAVTGKSLTMAWSYILMGIGTLLNQLDTIATTFGDPNFKQQVTDFLHSDPKYLGYFTMMVSAVTIAARLRSIGK